MELGDWKDKLGAAFDYDPAAVAPTTNDDTPITVVEQQGKSPLKILLDKKGRKGKEATLVVDFKCDEAALKSLASDLKRHCGVGGSARGGEILIQGDQREKVLQFLTRQGFKARVI